MGPQYHVTTFLKCEWTAVPMKIRHAGLTQVDIHSINVFIFTPQCSGLLTTDSDKNAVSSEEVTWSFMLKRLVILKKNYNAMGKCIKDEY